MMQKQYNMGGFSEQGFKTKNTWVATFAFVPNLSPLFKHLSI